MTRSMLTVFKSNEEALEFYQKKKRGYTPDKSDPGVCAGGDDPECGYRILSKPLEEPDPKAIAAAERKEKKHLQNPNLPKPKTKTNVIVGQEHQIWM